MVTKKKVLSVRRVRKQLGLTKKQLREWVERGYIRPAKVGKSGFQGFTAGLLTGVEDVQEVVQDRRQHGRS